MFLPFTRDHNNCRWSDQRKNISEAKFNYCKKTMEMNKVLISAPKTSRFFKVLWLRNDTVSSTQFFHTHIKDWQVKISLYISLYTYKFLKFVKDNWQNVLKCVWKGIHIYKICMQFYEKINSLTKVWRI